MSNKSNNKKIDSNMGVALFSDRERFEMWFAENWKKTAIISLAVVVIISLAFGIVGKISENKAAGAAELAAATTVDTLKAALAKHSDNPASPMARLRMANMLFDAARYSDATAYLKEIVDDADADQTLIATARLNIAKALELSGKREEAAKAFSSSAAASAGNFSIKCESAFSAARLLAKLGKTAAALEEIQSIEAAQNAQNAMNPYAADAAALKVAIESGEYGKVK